MTAPFIGAKVLTSIDLGELLPLLNKVALFNSRWGFSNEDKELAEDILDNVIYTCKDNKLIDAKIVYGYFKGYSKGDSLFIEADGNKYQFDFPRQREKENLCIADFFDKEDATIPIQIVTVGSKIIDYGEALNANGEFANYLFYSGLGAECAEALADYSHQMILEELCHPERSEGSRVSTLDPSVATLPQDDVKIGQRFSLGYPPCPNIEDQQKIFCLLKPDRIGVRLTETFLMEPEYSTSAIISLDPNAKYFSI